MKIAIPVAASIPTMTTVPRIRLETAPAPVAIQSGEDPRMKAKDVIRIGRRRKRAPSSAASSKSRPFSNSAFANSTIRIAFFAASPIKQPQERAKDRDRHRQQDGERERPALVKCRKDQEH